MCISVLHAEFVTCYILYGGRMQQNWGPAVFLLSVQFFLSEWPFCTRSLNSPEHSLETDNTCTFPLCVSLDTVFILVQHLCRTDAATLTSTADRVTLIDFSVYNSFDVQNNNLNYFTIFTQRLFEYSHKLPVPSFSTCWTG